MNVEILMSILRDMDIIIKNKRIVCSYIDYTDNLNAISNYNIMFFIKCYVYYEDYTDEVFWSNPIICEYINRVGFNIFVSELRKLGYSITWYNCIIPPNDNI